MNCLPGVISAIEIGGSVALVDVSAAGQQLTATMLDSSGQAHRWSIGMAVSLLFAETDVALAKDLTGRLSMRNRIRATVQTIESGQILSKVELDVGGNRLYSIITTRSAHALALRVGDTVEALVKANEMSVVPAGAVRSILRPEADT